MVEVRLISLLYYAAISKEEWKMMSGKVNASISNEDWYDKIMNHNNYELLFNKNISKEGIMKIVIRVVDVFDETICWYQ